MPFQDGISWSGNLHWGAATDGNAPAGSFSRADPKLVAGPDGDPPAHRGQPGDQRRQPFLP